MVDPEPEPEVSNGTPAVDNDDSRNIEKRALALGMAGAAAATAGCVLLIWGFLFDPSYAWKDQIWYFQSPIAKTGAVILGSGASLLAALARYSQTKRQRQAAKNVRILEQSVRKNPEKPQLAWELARTKLENYLDRNLNQVSAIFYLTTAVMAAGMILIFFGVWRGITNPSAIQPAALAALSGLIVQAIGGTLLLIYKSTMSQAGSFVAILERINAVGMSINILEAIDDGEAKMRNGLRAEIARDLLGLYGVTPRSIKPAGARKRPSGKPAGNELGEI